MPTNPIEPSPVDIVNARLSRIKVLQEENNCQIGRLTEMVTTGFIELKAITQRQAETAERQEQNISRLAATTEKLATTVDTLVDRLATTVDRQAQLVDKQVQLVDRLLTRDS